MDFRKKKQKNVDGGKTNITSPGCASWVNLTLPTASSNGSLNITSSVEVTNVSVDVGQFVKNPLAGVHTFVADGATGSGTSDVMIIPDTITTFDVTAATNVAGATSSYAVQLNTTGFT